MTTSEFRFHERLRVRRAEIDRQGVVFNAHHLMYIDTAFTGYWRALALPYAQTLEYLGGELLVRKATLEYESPARLDDMLRVGIRCGRIGTSSMTFQAAVFRGEQRLVSGEANKMIAYELGASPRTIEQHRARIMEKMDAGSLAELVRMAVGSLT